MRKASGWASSHPDSRPDRSDSVNRVSNMARLSTRTRRNEKVTGENELPDANGSGHGATALAGVFHLPCPRTMDRPERTGDAKVCGRRFMTESRLAVGSKRTSGKYSLSTQLYVLVERLTGADRIVNSPRNPDFPRVGS